MRERRISALFGLTGIIFLVLVARLVMLQLISVQKYKRLAKENYVKPIVIKAPRGIIYTRDGKIIADNVPSYTIIVDSNLVTNKEYAVLCSLLTMEHSLQNRYVINKVPFHIICKIEESKEKFPNVEAAIEPLRRYPYTEVFSHLTGYTSEISKQELETYSGYNLGVTIGKSGIERKYEDFIRGKDGIRYVEVNAKGCELELLSYTSPQPGSNLWLNIDFDLQMFAYETLPDKGVCVAMNPTNGEVLIWVSKPGFDPNLFSSGIPREIWQNWTEDSLSPLWDRVFKGCFPPASVFKLVTAGCGIEKGIVAPNTKQLAPCKGSITIGRREFKCWETHGSLPLMDAIIQSCDIYFYQLGMQLGVELITTQAKKVGFGAKTGVDIPGEISGFIPSEKWYDKRYGKGRWGKGIPANLAVGQGEILVTPLQILYFVSGIANKGILCQPRIVNRAVNPDGEVIFLSSASFSNLPWKQETIEIIRQGMLGVVEASNGTGRLARVPGIQVAGKTGTAQNPRGEDHAWFVAFAPYEDPQICIVVFVEHGGMGGSVAAPIAGQILKKFFEKSKILISNSETNSNTKSRTRREVGEL